VRCWCHCGLSRIYAHLQEAAGNGAKLVVLPEMWNCPYSNDSFPVYAEDIDGGASPSADVLSKVRLSRHNHIFAIAVNASPLSMHNWLVRVAERDTVGRLQRSTA
jgi:predicted amidohydrolase